MRKGERMAKRSGACASGDRGNDEAAKVRGGYTLTAVPSQMTAGSFSCYKEQIYVIRKAEDKKERAEQKEKEKRKKKTTTRTENRQRLAERIRATKRGKRMSLRTYPVTETGTRYCCSRSAESPVVVVVVVVADDDVVHQFYTPAIDSGSYS